MRREITLVFPHQLFERHPGLKRGRPVYLVEDSLFFGDPRYPVRFHKHKLMLHIATMAHYREHLRSRGYTVETIVYQPGRTIVEVLTDLAADNDSPVGVSQTVAAIHLCEVTDDVLTRRIERVAARDGISIHWYESPLFLTPGRWLREQLAGGGDTTGGPPRMQHFYIAQRKRMGILIEADSGGGDDPRPVGGRWSYDAENRKSWPARQDPPPDPHAPATGETRAAATRVGREFPENPGTTDSFWYPVTHAAAREWFERFLDTRFSLFGRYEDAICETGTVLYHSVLSPLLNIGLITPMEILEILDRRCPLEADIGDELLAGREGFIRQVIGWREYLRGIYLYYGVRQRTSNFWNHSRPMPGAFYRGTSGLVPLDTVVRRVIDRSYCHHIERLMVIGNVMLLSEIDPDEVYRWFMELFIDAYDWVMVPNVYGMSQFADGGLMASKPYISGANYVRKMSDYRAGEWEHVWTALFWRFLDAHRSFFTRRPRMKMLVSHLDGDATRVSAYRAEADRFFESLSDGPVG